MKRNLKLGGIYTVEEKFVVQCTAVHDDGVTGEFSNLITLDNSNAEPSESARTNPELTREATDPERRFFFDVIAGRSGLKNDHYLGDDALKAGSLVKINDNLLAVICTDVKIKDKEYRHLNCMRCYSLDEHKEVSLADRITKISLPWEYEVEEFWKYWTEREKSENRSLSNKQKLALDEIIEGGLLTDALKYLDDEYDSMEDDLLEAMEVTFMTEYVDKDEIEFDEVCDDFSAEEESCDAKTLGQTLRDCDKNFVLDVLYEYLGMGHYAPAGEMIDELKKQLA